MYNANYEFYNNHYKNPATTSLTTTTTTKTHSNVEKQQVSTTQKSTYFNFMGTIKTLNCTKFANVVKLFKLVCRLLSNQPTIVIQQPCIQGLGYSMFNGMVECQTYTTFNI